MIISINLTDIPNTRLSLHDIIKMVQLALKAHGLGDTSSMARQMHSITLHLQATLLSKLSLTEEGTTN